MTQDERDLVIGVALVAALIRETNGGINIKDSVEAAREYLKASKEALDLSKYNL